MDINYKEIWGGGAVFLSFANLFLYMRGIARGETRPHAFSWMLWAVVMAIIFCAQIVGHAGAGAWAVGTGALLNGLVALYAFKSGDVKITRSDWAALLVALAAIPLWLLTDEPFLAVLLLTVIDTLGFYPTFRKSYGDPHHEDLLVFCISTIIYVLNALAVEMYSKLTLLYPLTMVVANAALVVMLVIRRRYIPRPMRTP